MVFGILACTSSNSAYGSPMNAARLQFGGSTNPILARQEDVERRVSGEIAAIKAAAGLTWLQLANLLRVSRRTVHSWAEGKEPSGNNLAHVHALLEKVNSLSSLPMFKVRKQLLEEAAIVTLRPPDAIAAPILMADPSPIKHQHEVRRRKTTTSG
jgi:DNA-binding transcriptional regulator YiaG